MMYCVKYFLGRSLHSRYAASKPYFGWRRIHSDGWFNLCTCVISIVIQNWMVFCQLTPVCDTVGLSLRMTSDYATMTVTGEVVARDHKESSCLLIVWQDVCDVRFQSFYVRAIFKTHTISPQNDIHLPALHSPLSFSGALTAFQDGEAVVKIEDHSHFRLFWISTEILWTALDLYSPTS